MANSKYEYVKRFEAKDKIMLPNIIIVRVEGRNDTLRFSEVHEFEKPYDKKALDLMNECAKAVLEEFPDVIFSYGYNEEYSFIFKKETKIYQRRGSKTLSLLASFFTSTYVCKWRAVFPQKDLKSTPSFRARVICYASLEVLQHYLSWRQNECHINNLYDTCLWKLIKSGKTHDEAKEMLKVEDIVKYKGNGCPVKRRRRKVITVHSEDFASKIFWNDKLYLSKELGQFTEDVNKIRLEYVESFQFESELMLSTWIVICIDCCHFHRFSDVHEFEKPNDARALNLMNSGAVDVLEEFKDIIFAYGVSDEYSFVLTKDSQLYQRCASEIVSAVVSFFSSRYTMRWYEFFPHKEMKYLPYFDGRGVCYPFCELKDYLAWRLVDCHINNQYNTCFWLLVKSGKSKSDAQNYLKETKMLDDEEGAGKLPTRVIISYCDIIETRFWVAHPQILDEKLRKH